MKLFAPNLTDYYKRGHIHQYPPGTELVYSNFTPRNDKWANVLPDFDHKYVWFGLQGACSWYLRDLWNETFFNRRKNDVMEQYLRREKNIGDGSKISLDHISSLYDLGYLPISIKSLPEGSRVPMKVAAFTIQNTLPEFFWVTNYIETPLSAILWKSLTTATTAYEYRRLLDQYVVKTGSPKEFVKWQGHDFSFRGLSGVHDAAMSGVGHLLSFAGTDTIPALDYAEEYYFGYMDQLLGGSVPATEHSVMCMGQVDGELETFRHLIEDVYPSGIVSIVSDTWDFWKVLSEYALTLKEKILNRTPDNFGLAKVVFRPDSGNPVKIICGDPKGKTEEERKGALQLLWEVFGGTLTSTGHKLLDSHIGLIYGDSITLQIAEEILDRMDQLGFASANMVFGIGSHTYQYVTRDSYGTAMKATYGVVDGVGRELFKDPITDSGVKRSAKGLLRIEHINGTFVQYDQQTPEQENRGMLSEIFCDGEVYDTHDISEIRHRLHGYNF
jgi:nicotinamide phosphoribosyltransferase